MKYLWDRIVSLAGSNFGLKVLAIVIAVGLWVAGHRDVERAVEVPVEFRNIPSDLMVLDNRVDYVVLRLMGPRTLVSTLDAGDLKLGLDLDGAKVFVQFSHHVCATAEPPDDVLVVPRGRRGPCLRG